MSLTRVVNHTWNSNCRSKGTSRHGQSWQALPSEARRVLGPRHSTSPLAPHKPNKRNRLNRFCGIRQRSILGSALEGSRHKTPFCSQRQSGISILSVSFHETVSRPGHFWNWLLLLGKCSNRSSRKIHYIKYYIIYYIICLAKLP